MPTATMVTDEFLLLAKTESLTRGLGDLRLIELPHPVGSVSLDILRSLAESRIDSIVKVLTAGESCSDDPLLAADDSGDECTATLEVPADPGLMFQYFINRGWSDGLPVLPPTEAAIDVMIGASHLKRDELLGIIPPVNGIATVERVAANAVMAGCLPDYFPLVVAAVRGVLQPGFNLDGVQTTTGNVAPVVIINGPCRNTLQINYSSNVLGQGWRANSTIGRALRLVLSNIGGATPGVYDKATLGQPAKYTFCFAENEEDNPWEPLHVECGWSREMDVVSVFGCSGVNSAVDMASQTAKGLLKTFALTMIGGFTSGVTSTETMLIICPEHAAILSAGGYSKAAIRNELFRAARVPHEKISDENLELLAKRRPIWFQRGESAIDVVDRPEDIWIVVAGGKGAKSAYIPGRTGTHLQTTAQPITPQRSIVTAHEAADRKRIGAPMKRFIDLALTAMAVVCLMPGSGASQTKSIIVGEGVRGAMYMPAYIAEEKGYFKRRDLDSKIVTFSRSNDINALVSGDIQFDQTSPDKVIHSALGGFPVKMVMATTRGLNLALVVHPSIKSAADLKGKSVAITSFSGLPYTGLLLCLKELGLTREQVVPLNVGGKAARFEALVNNKVAAAILDPPYTTMAAKEGFKLIVDLTPLDVPYLRNIVAVSERSLRQEPRVISKFVEALAEGMLFYRNSANKEENIRILAKYLRVPPDKNRAMVEEGYETYRDMLLKKPYADPSAMKILLDVIAESNPKAKNVNLASLIDSSFVERLDQEGLFGK